MSTPTGRDGRPLVTTRQAAYSRSAPSPAAFRAWARRHGIKSAAYRTNGPGQPEALWDLADITDTLAQKLTNR